MVGSEFGYKSCKLIRKQKCAHLLGMFKRLKRVIIRVIQLNSVWKFGKCGLNVMKQL